jgi:hypothetical protein
VWLSIWLGGAVLSLLEILGTFPVVASLTGYGAGRAATRGGNPHQCVAFPVASGALLVSAVRGVSVALPNLLARARETPRNALDGVLRAWRRRVFVGSDYGHERRRATRLRTRIEASCYRDAARAGFQPRRIVSRMVS